MVTSLRHFLVWAGMCFNVFFIFLLLRVRHDWMTSLSLFTFMHWRRKWQPTPVFLPGESQGQRSLVGCHLWGRTESDMTERLSSSSSSSCFWWYWSSYVSGRCLYIYNEYFLKSCPFFFSFFSTDDGELTQVLITQHMGDGWTPSTLLSTPPSFWLN